METINDKINDTQEEMIKDRYEYLKERILKLIYIISAKHEKINKNVQFFIDTSGIEGYDSNDELKSVITEIVHSLENEGYECLLTSCENGFYDHDMVDDNIYCTREKLENYGVGRVRTIACPTVETAALMADDADFSIIFADFDGLTSICRMAGLCKKDKVPYFLCSEDRYSWENPTYNEWVDPDESYYYNPERVIDISLRGMPSLEEFFKRKKENEYYNDGIIDEKKEINSYNNQKYSNTNNRDVNTYEEGNNDYYRE